MSCHAPTTNPNQQHGRHRVPFVSGGDGANLQGRHKRKQDEMMASPLTDKQEISSIVTKRLWSEDCKDVEEAMGSLKKLLEKNAKNREIAFRRGAPLAIVKAMSRNQDSPEIQKQGCLALSEISVLHDTEEDIIDTGGLQVCLAALERNPDHTMLLAAGCTFIGNLCCCPKACKIVLLEVGLKAVMKAMGNHKQSMLVQRYGCFALVRLVLLDHQAVVGINAVIEAMGSHPDDAELQEHGCDFLRVLSDAGEVFRSMIIDAKGLNAVVDARHIHKNNKDIVTKARQAIKSIESL